MKAFRSFDNVTTPERWKQRALEISGYEKPKLKKTYEIAVVAAAAVFAVAVVAVNSFVKFGNADSLDEDLTPEVTMQAPAASGEDAFEDAVVSQSDERYNIVGNSDGSYQRVYGFHNEGLQVNYPDDLENITNERIAKDGYASGVIIRMEKNEEYTTLYLAAEDPVCVIERDDYVCVVKSYDPEQYAKDGRIEIYEPENSEVVKVRVKNDMPPSDNFSDEGTPGLDEHKFVVNSGAFLFFDKDEAANDIENGRLPVASKYYLYSSAPLFCTQEEYSEIERLADIASDCGSDKQLKEDLILGQVMNLDKKKPGSRIRLSNVEKPENLKAAFGDIAFDPEGDTMYLVERIVPCAPNDTQTIEIEGRESKTIVFSDDTADFDNVQAVFDGTDSADIFNSDDKICEVKLNTNFGGKAKDIKIVHPADTTELYIVATIEDSVGTKDDIDYMVIAYEDPIPLMISEFDIENPGDKSLYIDYEEWQSLYAAGEDVNEKTFLVRVQKESFIDLLAQKGVRSITELNKREVYGVLIYPDELKKLYEYPDAFGEEHEAVITMSFDFTGAEE